MKTLEQLRFDHGIPVQILDLMKERDAEWQAILDAMTVTGDGQARFVAEARAAAFREGAEAMRAAAVKLLNSFAGEVDDYRAFAAWEVRDRVAALAAPTAPLAGEGVVKP